MNVLQIIGRSQPLFSNDIKSFAVELEEIIRSSNVLVIGAAGSIGQAVTLEIFKRNPKVLDVVDINENNMVELVRTIRSSIGYTDCEFNTFAIDCGSNEFHALCRDKTNYDYIFNLSALKHVRSERDPYTLMRMIDVNIFNTLSTLKISKKHSAKKYFCVSTDKAANPVNMMGASKRIMEHFLIRESVEQKVSMARFANVAFSDGSLLHGFNQRFQKRQPLTAPSDIKRYFVTPQESGELVLLSGLLGENREIYFPKLTGELHFETFPNIALRFLEAMGFDPYLCSSEDEARSKCADLIARKKWPVYFFESDTSGEKDFEEFFTAKESVNFEKYEGVGVIKHSDNVDYEKLVYFENRIEEIRHAQNWNKAEIVELFNYMLPEFQHNETGKNLNNRM